MAAKFKRILVTVRDLDGRPHAAMLRKAAWLARASGASIELFHAITEPVFMSTARGEGFGTTLKESMTSATARFEARLARMARSRALADVEVSIHASWDYPPHEAIVRRALATRADLVVAQTRPHRFGARVFLANTDWELIRSCPCALLLVKSGGDYEGANVLAAIDPFHANDKPATLDLRLLEAGRDLAKRLRGELHAFHAYLPLGAMLPSALGQPVPMAVPPDVEAEQEERVRAAFERLAAKAGVAPARRHLSCGDVPSRLRDAVRESRAKIVVMGAVSRSALKRLFIGSTAERVLDAVSCDVLVLKPRAFRTAVPRIPPRFLGTTVY